MTKKTILIHTHFHNRRTGVTGSIENILHLFDATFDSYVFGYGIKGRKISLFKVLKLVFSRTYFVMHCHRNNELMLALLFKLLGGKFKLVATRHSSTKPSALTKYLLQSSDRLITLNKNMALHFDKSSEIIFHGIDVANFNPSDRARISNISQKNIISCVGRVRKAKGQKVLVEAIAPIICNYPDWALVIVGKVDNKEFLKELNKIITEHKAESQIYFLEETPNILEVYQASHTVVVPSYTEGCSLVTVEAMSCGCNVIATKNVGTHSELFQHQNNGYLFEAGNVTELSHLLDLLMKGKLNFLGSEARDTVVNAWSSEHEAQKLEQLYLE